MRIPGASLIAEFDGRHFTEEDLRALSGNFSSNLEPRLDELSVAISAAAVGGNQVEFSVSGPDHSQRLFIREGDVTLLPGRDSEESLAQFCLKTPEPEKYAEALRVNGAFAPLKLTLHWKNSSFPLEYLLQGAETFGRLELVGHERLRSEPSDNGTNQVLRSADGPSLLLYIVDPESDIGGTLHLLSNGVKMATDKDIALPKFLWGAATVNHLKKDLTRSQIIQDKEFERFQSWLDCHILSLLESFIASHVDPPSQVSFCSEIRKKYSTFVPIRVRAFLQSYEDFRYPLPQEKINLVLGEAKSSGDWQVVERLLVTIQRESYRVLIGKGAEDALDTFRELALELRLRYPHLGLSYDAALFLTRRGLPDKKDVLDELVDVPSDPNLKVRAILMLFPQLPRESLVGFIRELPEAQSEWRNLLLFCLGCPPEAPSEHLLTRLHRFRSGDWGDGLSLYDQYAARFPGRRTGALTANLFYRLCLGKVSWLQQVRWKVYLAEKALSSSERTLLELAEDWVNGEAFELPLLDVGASRALLLFYCCLPGFESRDMGGLSRVLLLDSFRTSGVLCVDSALGNGAITS